MRELFIYYRVRAGHESAALSVVNAYQLRLRQRHPQLRARLMRRTPAADGPITWMETYALEPAAATGITDALQQEIELASTPLLAFIEGTRHVEVFEPVPGQT